MGRALVREPAVFLMDEPLSNLDAKLRVQMRTEVLRVQRRLGVATLYVTHDQTEAMTMGDRVAVLRAGSLQQLARPQELYDQPANLFVASFMGSPSMNLYEASVSRPGRARRGEARLAGADCSRQSTGARLPGLIGSSGRQLIVGIRPEHLSVAPGATPAQGRQLVATVELVEALGNEQLVHFAIDAPTLSRSSRRGERRRRARPAGSPARHSRTASPASTQARRIATGERATFFVDVERLHFFDPGTGASLGHV